MTTRISRLFRNAAHFRQTRYIEAVNSPTSPIEEFRDDGSRAMRTVFVRWEDRVQAVKDFLGYPFTSPLNGGGECISRITPHEYPEDGYSGNKGQSRLYCTQVAKIEPHGVPEHEDDHRGAIPMRDTSTDLAKYGLAKMTLLYESLPYDIRQDGEINQDSGGPDESGLQRYVTKLFQPASEILPMPLNTFNKVGGTGGGDVPGQPGKRIPSGTLTLIWRRIPERAVGSKLLNPVTTLASYPIDDAIGQINSATFANCLKGTLLLTAVNITPLRSPIAGRLYDVEYKFKYDPGGHYKLHLPNTATGTLEKVEIRVVPSTDPNSTTQTAGKSIYDWYDFRKFFRVPT